MTQRDFKPANLLDEAIARNLDLSDRTRELYRECIAGSLILAEDQRHAQALARDLLADGHRVIVRGVYVLTTAEL